MVRLPVVLDALVVLFGAPDDQARLIIKAKLPTTPEQIKIENRKVFIRASFQMFSLAIAEPMPIRYISSGRS